MNKPAVIHPDLLTALSPNFYPSALTIQVGTETASGTGELSVSWANVTGMVAIACRIAPANANERRTEQQVLSVHEWTCDVAQALTGVTTKHRAVVDSVNYDILVVQYDGENPRHSTRLTLKLVT